MARSRQEVLDAWAEARLRRLVPEPPWPSVVTVALTGFLRGVFYGLVVGAGIIVTVSVVYLGRYVLGCS